MRLRMPSYEDLEDEVKTFSGKVEDLDTRTRTDLTNIEQHLRMVVSSVENRLLQLGQRMDDVSALAQRAEQTSNQAVFAVQEVLNKMSRTENEILKQLLDVKKENREQTESIRAQTEHVLKLQENKSDKMTQVAAALVPVIVALGTAINIWLTTRGH